MAAQPAWRFFLPYCLQQLEDKSYIVLNRNYKPLGQMTNDYVIYEREDRIQLKLTKKLIQALSWNGSSDEKTIYLYSDSTHPYSSAAHTAAYFARLERLMKLSAPRAKPILSALMRLA